VLPLSRMWHKSDRKLRKVKKRSPGLTPQTMMVLRHVVVGFLSILTASGLVWSIWSVTRIEHFTISEISISGLQSISEEEIRGIAMQVLEGDYLKLIPRRFIFLYPEQHILEKIIEFPRVKSVTVQRSSLQSIAIDIVEYTPFALWCDDLEGKRCLYVDESGFAYDSSPSLQGGTFLRYRTVGRSATLRTHLTDTEQLESIHFIVNFIESKFDFLVQSIELDVVGDVFLVLPKGSEIKVSKRLSVQDTLRNLDAVLSADEFKKLQPGDFNYIDLRFGSKVFVSDEKLPIIDDTSLTEASEGVASSDLLEHASSDIEIDIIVPAIVEMVDEVPVAATNDD
jgi:cell division septal protein FtsQ